MTFELVHNQDPGEFKTGMDISLTNGDISTISGDKELIQDVIKATLTRKQPSGYGTYNYKLVGTKNTVFLRSMIIIAVLESLQFYKFLQTKAYALGRLNSGALLKTVEFVKVTSNQQTITFNVRIVSGVGNATEITTGV